MEAGSHKRMKTCSEWTNGVELEFGSQKRSKTCNGWPSDGGFSKFAALNGICYGSGVTQTPSKVNGQGDPFALPLLLENLADGQYGSVTREFEALRAQNMQMMNVLYALRSLYRGSSSSPSVVSPISNIENPVSTHKHGHNLSEQPAGKLFHSNGPNVIQNSKKDSENAISIPIHIEKSNVNTTPQDPHLTSQLETNGMQIIVIDSDDETEPPTCSRHEADDSRLWQIMPQESIHQDQLKTPFHGSYYGQVLDCQTSGYGTIDSVGACRNIWQPSVQYEKVSLTNSTEKGPLPDLVDEKHETNFSLLRKLGASPRPRHNKPFPQFAKSTINNKENNNEKKNKLESNATEKAIFDEDMQHESPSLESMSEGTIDSDSEASETDGLDDLWKDMSLAMECSKNAVVDVPLAVEKEEEQECDHSYVLKDDLGLVCRICGIIQKSIEKIFDYQWAKGSRTIRTYISESRNTRDSERSISFSGLKSLEHDLLAAEIAIHPRHEKQMKPHQLEGFRFLVRNLVSDKPGGCILAHAPGSGKTFMLISFIQSFLGKYPFARPLIILPKGILSTWKREFKKWQVEEIPLYDFYSVKADSRSQQLEVLKSWVEEKSILFLGYKQFSNIVCDAATSIAAGQCRESLLKVPSLLIIDEGHTPRNDNTDVLHSLAKIQTPRKVVLSGTLFQNHVKEVFNILNLVRPKFLKMDASRAVVGRIMSRVQISGARNRTDINAHFFECVEETLQNEDNSKRKVTVIRDLREMTKEVLHYYKGDFLEELPGLVDFTVLLKLSLKQKAIVRKLGKMDKFRRSSLCSAIYLHPYLNEISENITVEKGYACEEKIDSIIDRLDVSHGIKTKFFLNILSMAVSAGERVLVFSHYLLPLKFLERLLARMKGWRSGREMFMISGDSSPDQRELAMEQINCSLDAKILFGSIKACGEGISLVGASRVIILDVHLNPSVSRQAIGRAFRPGQTKKVHVYRLVAADSSEEEDHMTSFRKELTSKMWFEWNEYGDDQEFELGAVDAQDSEDVFFENPYLNEDIKCLYKR